MANLLFPSTDNIVHRHYIIVRSERSRLCVRVFSLAFSFTSFLLVDFIRYSTESKNNRL